MRAQELRSAANSLLQHLRGKQTFAALGKVQPKNADRQHVPDFDGLSFAWFHRKRPPAPNTRGKGGWVALWRKMGGLAIAARRGNARRIARMSNPPDSRVIVDTGRAREVRRRRIRRCTPAITEAGVRARLCW